MKLSLVGFLVLITAAFGAFSQTTSNNTPKNPMMHLAEVPLDPATFSFAFQITPTGGVMSITPLGERPQEAGAHLMLRSSRLAQMAVNCKLSAPEFGNAQSSPAAATLCASHGNLSVDIRHQHPGEHRVYTGLDMVFVARNPQAVAALQQFVLALAAQHPGADVKQGTN